MTEVGGATRVRADATSGSTKQKTCLNRAGGFW